MFRRLLGQEPEVDLLLGVGQLGWPPGGRPREQPGVALLPEGGDPPSHRARIDVEELGDLRDRVSVQDALDGQAATVFQFCGCALVSHNGECNRREAKRTLLF